MLTPDDPAAPPPSPSAVRLLSWFDTLPADVRARVFQHLHDAMLWRGWDARGGFIVGIPHSTPEVRAIADLFAANGREIEELT